MSGHDEQLCSLGWCGEVADHDGPHRQHLLDTLAMDVDTGRPVILQVNLQGESARVKALVLVTGAREVGLTWRQAGELTATLSGATRRYA